MAGILADSGAVDILNAAFNNVWPTGGKNLVMRLYTNNYAPTSTSTAANFTEANGGGYAPITLTNGSWVQSLVNSIEQMAYAQQVFGFTGPLTTNPLIYGYYLTDAAGTLFAAELLAVQFQPNYNGDQFFLTPIIQLSHGVAIA